MHLLQHTGYTSSGIVKIVPGLKRALGTLLGAGNDAGSDLVSSGYDEVEILMLYCASVEVNLSDLVVVKQQQSCSVS